MKWFLLIALLLIPAPAPAQAVACGPRDSIVRNLEAKYQETRVWYGVIGPRKIELFSAADGGSWTLIVSDPNGLSCVLLSGVGWRDVPREQEGEKAKWKRNGSKEGYMRDLDQGGGQSR